MPVVLPAVIALQPSGAGPGSGGVDTAWATALAGGGFPWVAVAVLGIPAAVAVALIWWYARTARRLRHAQLAPPVWLLPYLRTGSASPAPWPPTQTQAELAADLAERGESVGRLARQKRAILLGLGLNFVAGWAMAGAFLYESNRGGEFQELPALAGPERSVAAGRFEELGDQPVPEAAPPPEEPSSPVMTTVLDSAEVRRRAEQRAAILRRQDSVRLVALQDSMARETQRVRDSVAQAVRDSIAREAAARVVMAPPPVPAPAPPPAPPAGAPDPAREVEAASAALGVAARELVEALGTGAAAAAPHLRGGETRDRLLRFLRESAPTATLGAVGSPALDSGSGTARVMVQLQWRGTFGNAQRRTLPFQATLIRGADGWQVSGFQPLENMP